MRTLSDFNGRYHAIPNVLSDFLKKDEYMVFTHIYKASRRNIFDGAISLSKETLKNGTHLGSDVVPASIQRLVSLGLIVASQGTGKTSVFYINAEEIFALDSFARTISYDGVYKLRGLCEKQKGTLIPFSQIPAKQLQEFAQKHPIPEDIQATSPILGKKAKSGEVEGASNNVTSPDLAKIGEIGEVGIQNGDTVAQILNNIALYCDNYGTDSTTSPILRTIAQAFGDLSVTSPKIDNTRKSGEVAHQTSPDLTKKPKIGEVETSVCIPTSPKMTENGKTGEVTCNPSSHFINKTENGFEMCVILSNAERYLLEMVGENNVAVRFSTSPILPFYPKSGEVGALTSPDFPKKGRNQETSIYNREDNKKDELTERSEVSYIGEENVEKDLEGGFEGLEIVDLKEEEPFKKISSTTSEPLTVSNPYKDKPYVSRDRMNILVSNPELCKSPVELFISNLWLELFEVFPGLSNEQIEARKKCQKDYRLSEQEIEEGQAPEDLDMIGWRVPDSVLCHICEQALDDTIADIQAGFIKIEDKKYKLKFCGQLPDDFQPGFVVDWKHGTTDDGERAWIVEFDKFRDVSAIGTSISSPVTKEEKRAANRANKQYISDVRNATSGQLTPMEQMLQVFLRDFASFDEVGIMVDYLDGNRVEDKDGNIKTMPAVSPGRKICAWRLNEWWVRNQNSFMVTRENLFEVLNVDNYAGVEDIQWVNTLISAKKAKRWHELHGMTSQLLP